MSSSSDIPQVNHQKLFTKKNNNFKIRETLTIESHIARESLEKRVKRKNRKLTSAKTKMSICDKLYNNN